MGRLFDQPPRSHLPANGSGRQAPRARSIELRANARGDHASSSAGGIMNWLRHLFSRRRLYDDLDDEIAFHLEEKIDELVAGGMPLKEATAAARREFGNVELLRE